MNKTRRRAVEAVEWGDVYLYTLWENDNKWTEEEFNRLHTKKHLLAGHKHHQFYSLRQVAVLIILSITVCYHFTLARGSVIEVQDSDETSLREGGWFDRTLEGEMSMSSVDEGDEVLKRVMQPSSCSSAYTTRDGTAIPAVALEISIECDGPLVKDSEEEVAKARNVQDLLGDVTCEDLAVVSATATGEDLAQVLSLYALCAAAELLINAGNTCKEQAAGRKRYVELPPFFTSRGGPSSSFFTTLENIQSSFSRGVPSLDEIRTLYTRIVPDKPRSTICLGPGRKYCRDDLRLLDQCSETCVSFLEGKGTRTSLSVGSDVISLGLSFFSIFASAVPAGAALPATADTVIEIISTSSRLLEIAGDSICKECATAAVLNELCGLWDADEFSFVAPSMAPILAQRPFLDQDPLQPVIPDADTTRGPTPRRVITGGGRPLGP
jgi:hypothetical protein